MSAGATFGVVLGRGLGLRMLKTDPQYQAQPVLWRARAVPALYQYSDVEDLLGAMGFSQAVITSKLRASRKNDWCFKATRGDDLQVVQTPIKWDVDAEETDFIVVKPRRAPGEEPNPRLAGPFRNLGESPLVRFLQRLRLLLSAGHLG